MVILQKDLSGRIYLPKKKGKKILYPSEILK